MKKDFAGKKFFIRVITVFLALMIGLSAGVVYAQPMLVMQPVYAGMRFYVHQPQCIPANWFQTFDGYPVWRSSDGVWFYGSYSNRNIIHTNHVVGSVIPSAVGIHPYVIQTNVVTAFPAPVMAAPVMAVPAAPHSGVAAAHPFPVLAQPAPVVVHAPAVATAVIPFVNWSICPSFMVLGNWRKNVDRVGILISPSIPVAWNGMRPNVIYAWTGQQWFQMTANEGERPGDVLRNNLYLLTRLVHQNGSRHWKTPDIAFLISQTAQWGYIWMGQIGPNPRRVY